MMTDMWEEKDEEEKKGTGGVIRGAEGQPRSTSAYDM